MKNFIFKLLPYYQGIRRRQRHCESMIYKVVTYYGLSYYLSYYQLTTFSVV